MAKYYFLLCSLPKLSLDEKPELSFDELMAFLRLNLTDEDLKKVGLLREYADIRNLRAIWEGRPIEGGGSLSQKELEEALLVKDYLPGYVFDFMEEHDSVEERLRSFAELISSFYKEEMKEGGFLEEFFIFEWKCRLILTAIRARKMGRDLSEELHFEDSKDFFVASLLQNEKELVLPRKFIKLKEIYFKYAEEPYRLERAVAEFRFKRISEMAESSYFEMDQILRYLMLFLYVEHWQSFSKVKGKEILETIY